MSERRVRCPACRRLYLTRELIYAGGRCQPCDQEGRPLEQRGKHLTRCENRDCGVCGSCRISASLRAQHAAGRRPRNTRYKNSWSSDEDALLRQLAGTRHTAEIAAELTRRYFPRTVPAVAQRAIRLGVYLMRNHLTASSFAAALGCSRMRMQKILDSGLPAEHLPTSGSGLYRIEQEDAERWIREHPWAFNPRLVDQRTPLGRLAWIVSQRNPWYSVVEIAKMLHADRETVRRRLFDQPNQWRVAGVKGSHLEEGMRVYQPDVIPLVRARIDFGTMRALEQRFPANRREDVA